MECHGGESIVTGYQNFNRQHTHTWNSIFVRHTRRSLVYTLGTLSVLVTLETCKVNVSYCWGDVNVRWRSNARLPSPRTCQVNLALCVCVIPSLNVVCSDRSRREMTGHHLPSEKSALPIKTNFLSAKGGPHPPSSFHIHTWQPFLSDLFLLFVPICVITLGIEFGWVSAGCRLDWPLVVGGGAKRRGGKQWLTYTHTSSGQCPAKLTNSLPRDKHLIKSNPLSTLASAITSSHFLHDHYLHPHLTRAVWMGSLGEESATFLIPFNG